MRSKFKWIFTLLLALSMQFSFAQEKTVTGVVSDASGTLPGANVVVKGTTRGTQTDIDGKYSIKASAGEVLVFSFVGMADFQATVGASSVVNATLKTGDVQIGEVVVTGALGIRRKQNSITYTNQVVKAEELTQAANPNVIQSLAGKVSGLQINTTNSAVNATTRIVIRSPKSLTQNNQALVVIDGVISSASILQSLAPETIESSNVIKGAQGAALYGSDGVNGVIIITTKRGSQNEKMSVNVTSSIDFSEVAYLPERQTRYGQGWDNQHYAYENGTWGPEFDGSLQPTGLPNADGTYNLLPFKSRGSDNIKDFYQTGTIAQTGVSLSSGDDKGYLFFSANNLKNDFIIDNDELRRNTFLFRAGKKAGKFSVDGNMTYITQRTNTTNSNLIYDLLQTPTNIDIRSFKNAGNEHNYSYFVRNPYWVVDNERNETRSDIFSGIVRLQYDINPHINVAYNANVNFIQNRTLSYINEYNDPYDITGTVGAQSIESSFDTSNGQSRGFYGDLFLNFDYDLTEKLNLKVNLGNNIRDNYNTTTTAGGTGLAIPGLYNISNVSSEVNAGNSYSRVRTYAFFGNLDLGYDDYLFLNATGRYEQVSYLDKDNNDFFYPSVGVSFVPTKAFDGLKDSFLSYAKIAASIVKVGRADIAAYAIQNTYIQATGFPFDGNNSYIPNVQSTIAASNITNPLIKPEFYTTSEVAVNLGFLKNRITLDASYYHSDNKDLITNTSASYASGTATFRTNIGQTTTNGVEVDLGLVPIKGDFTWDLRLSYSHARTVVDKVTDQADEVAIYSPYGTYGVFATKGEDYPIIKGSAYERDDQGRIIVDASTGLPQVQTGLVKLGNTTPDYILGLNTSFDYKGFRLAATMDYRTGHVYYSGTKQTLSSFGYNVDTAVNGRTGFILPNSSYLVAGEYVDNTSIVTGGSTYGSYQAYITGDYNDVSENFVLDATAFKVRELALSYGLSKELLRGTGFDAIRVGVNARNPFTVLPKENRGYDDPETSLSNGNIVGLASGTSRSGGTGTNQYPTTKSYGFTINLTF